MQRIRLGLAQVNTTVGDLDGNAERILDRVGEAEARGCDLVAFPELAVTGYPPEDLLLKASFVADAGRALERVAVGCGDIVALVGFVERDAERGTLHNALAVIVGGRVLGTYRKRLLPNYAVFDEERYFTPGSGPHRLFEVAGVRVGLTVCEDAWAAAGPVAEQAAGGAELVINASASPFHVGKAAVRLQMLRDRVDEAGCVIAYVNQVGGQDELVFDGGSLVVDPSGSVVAGAAQYAEDLLVVDLDIARVEPSGPTLEVVATGTPGRGGHRERRRAERGPVESVRTRPLDPPEPLDPLDEVYGALVLGTRDYCTKNGFTDVVLGLSGGVDSSLVAAVACDAVGADHVHGVLMPSRYSSGHSVTDAEQLASNLGIDRRTIGIEPAFAALLGMLSPSFDTAGLGDTESAPADAAADLTEQNLQPRIRGTVLMALSNRFGWLVLTTGNKSEMAVGYATLYGDMAGGFAVLKDVDKTTVYALCRALNSREGREVIPWSVIDKPPSAELRPGQKDTDTLPPYEVLDPILAAYVERDLSVAEIVEAGHDPVVVRQVARLVDLAEYKRRQAPPGVRVTTKAFGKDRRLPITQRYRG